MPVFVDVKVTTPMEGAERSRGDDHRRRNISCGEVLVSVMRRVAEPSIDCSAIAGDSVTSNGIEVFLLMLLEVIIKSPYVR